MAAGDLDANANDMEGVSGTMRAEEERMRAVSRKEEEQRASKLEKEREADIKGGKDGVDTKFKALEFLLSQSKVSGVRVNACSWTNHENSDEEMK